MKKNNLKTGFSEIAIVAILVIALAVAGIAYWYYNNNLSADTVMYEDKMEEKMIEEMPAEVSDSTDAETIEEEIENTIEGDLESDFMELDAEVSSL